MTRGWFRQQHRHRIASYGANIRNGYPIRSGFMASEMDFKIIDKSSPIMERMKDTDNALKKAKNYISEAERKFYLEISSAANDIRSDMKKLSDKFPKISVKSSEKDRKDYINGLIQIKKKTSALLDKIIEHDYSRHGSEEGKRETARLATQLANLRMRIMGEIDRISPGHNEGLKAEIIRVSKKAEKNSK